MRTALLAIGLFVLAWSFRQLYVSATPDAGWPYAVVYKGDAAIWLDHVEAQRRGERFEQGLPLRPPGMAWLLRPFWNGELERIRVLRGLMLVLGAASVALFFLIVRARFGVRAGLIAGSLAAASTGLMSLSAALNNETPYLLLVLASIGLAQTVAVSPRLAGLAVFGALQATACLFRVEHALFALLLTGHLVWRWTRISAAPEAPPSHGGATPRSRAIATRAATIALASFVVLVPWHVSAWGAIARFNAGEVPKDPRAEAAVARIEQSVAELRWEDGAREASAALPAFLRRSATAFVRATRAHRGETSVRAEDFDSILRAAFGSVPRELDAWPFITSYGALNFGLANHPLASGGFSRAALDEAPPLTGGSESYPPELVRGLPPPNLAFEYIPHLALFNHGYSRGWAWIRSSPGSFFELVGAKLGRFLAGATLGFGGDGRPLRASGVRNAVDLVVPEAGTGTLVWRIFLLGLAGVGFFVARPRAALVPWLLFLAAQLAISVLFFGYARQGAGVSYVLLLGAALALERPCLLAGRAGRFVLGGLALILVSLFVLELERARTGVEIHIDGRPVEGFDPLPPGDHGEHRITYRRRGAPRSVPGSIPGSGTDSGR